MTRSRRLTFLATIGLLVAFGAAAYGQNSAPNDYRAAGDSWGELPGGRTWGATSAIFPATDGSGDIWVGERCSANSCAETPEIDPILRFTADGEVVTSFGALNLPTTTHIIIKSVGKLALANMLSAKVSMPIRSLRTTIWATPFGSILTMMMF